MNGITILRCAGVLLAITAGAFAGWSEQASGVTSTLYDIECSGPDRAWAVGAGGTILSTSDSGATWSAQTSGTNSDLYGVDFTDSLYGWATGSGPTMVHTTDGGAHWSAQSPGGSDDLMDVAFASRSRGWVSGVNGAIIGTTDGGASWSSEVSGIWGWYWGITAASETAAWTIGGDWFKHVSPIYHYNGTNWSHQYDITRNQNGQDISVVEDSILWAVADSGTISHSTNGGTTWANQTSGTTAIINGVDAVSTDWCWTVGGGGLLLVTSDGGTTWVPDTSGVTGDLYGISMVDSDAGWACGAGGTILHRTGGGQAVAEHAATPLARSGATLVRDQLVLRLTGPAARVRIRDAAGRCVRELSLTPTAGELTVPLAGLPAGAYFARVGGPDSGGTVRFVKLD